MSDHQIRKCILYFTEMNQTDWFSYLIFIHMDLKEWEILTEFKPKLVKSEKDLL